ncbi:hypothetical protein HMPREF9336_03126 [Segniliparus rugosus ATCC BAA-974]|uniref:GST C-terminal domain-containing protein n=1 Tax=Segniliparus rugosus (strain ATCC BAA-974 / DSM 45345 / CCUG 50838 / CIP 108380 / JCM 13579 / CDC 945) TaxID=679197 RepID=E5XUF4_SEGRC|nr:hypothetical protein HMPREF9336_03126 [Segniliparus rugosus ATCC BAA-974]
MWRGGSIRTTVGIMALDTEFIRDSRYINTRITADGREGYPVEPGRYRLVAARACPWANRTLIVRRLLGLEGVLSLGLCGPTHDERSWTFDLDPGGLDPVLGIHWLRDAYNKRVPDYPRGVTVPAIVDIPTGAVVTNDFARITLDFSSEWRAHHREGAPDLYPEPLRAEIDEINQFVYESVNNGVYRCGFAKSQEAYDAAYDTLFSALDRLSERLATRRYLVGDAITEADVRLFVTLVRFDAVYHGHFKCNRQKLAENPVLWAYARDLFQTPGFGDTIDFQQIKSTTTRCISTSIPPGSRRKAPRSRTGSTPIRAPNSAGGRSGTEPRLGRRPPMKRCSTSSRRPGARS